MTRRKSPAGSKGGTGVATEAFIEAGRVNTAKGRAKKAEETRKAKEAGAKPAGDRWRQLLDGTLTVRDLDDQEIAKMAVRGRDGGFSGRRPAIPSHLAQQFKREGIRRAQDSIQTATPEVVKELLAMAKDPDVKDSDRIKILLYLADRQLGKTPETVRIEADTPFDKAVGRVSVDRGMVDAAAEAQRIIDET